MKLKGGYSLPMPNGGVPLNLELWVDPVGLGDIIWHQNGQVFAIRRVTSLEPPRAEELVGRGQIEAEFLLAMVNWFVNQDSASITSSQVFPHDGYSLNFEAGVLTFEAGMDVVTVSGVVLRHLVAFMAYWINHDGGAVPAGLKVEYPIEIVDSNGLRWKFNWAF